MNLGWIKLHRSILEWEWFRDHNTCRLFIYLLLTANHNETKCCGHIVPRGSCVAGYQKLSKETGLSVQELRTASAKLKSTGEITGKSTGKFSIITICNYEKYQAGETGDQQADQRGINRRSTGCAKQMAVNTSLNDPLRMEECKNITTLRKSACESTRFADFWTAYPRKKNKVDAAKAWNTAKGDSIFNEIFSGLQRAIVCPDWIKEGGKFIPYPASWLRAGGWMDETGISTTKSCQTCRHYTAPCHGKETACSGYEVAA